MIYKIFNDFTKKDWYNLYRTIENRLFDLYMLKHNNQYIHKEYMEYHKKYVKENPELHEFLCRILKYLTMEVDKEIECDI